MLPAVSQFVRKEIRSLYSSSLSSPFFTHNIKQFRGKIKGEKEDKITDASAREKQPQSTDKKM
jgi:HEPN domain-containing protein